MSHTHLWQAALDGSTEQMDRDWKGQCREWPKFLERFTNNSSVKFVDSPEHSLMGKLWAACERVGLSADCRPRVQFDKDLLPVGEPHEWSKEFHQRARTWKKRRHEWGKDFMRLLNDPDAPKESDAFKVCRGQ